MKKVFVLLMTLAVSAIAFAQQSVKVETYHLKNGLKVVLCEEHSQPKVYGCVVVHAGSRNENPAATGVAHYFEHIMFKGTDRIGTTDWSKEKPYLDSINAAYDRLHATQDAKERHAIQLEINRLNVAASKYAIPNEVDAILQNMGCTGLNAGTSYDYTVYYNTLPSNQLSNWMDVYVERFRNPVFRLFQSELEAVYEEKNMYENQMGYDFSRNLFTESFGDHPYSRDVIGLAEHLKNPQTSEMQKFFDTYYVANNMTLILVGDFNSADARSLIENKFSEWRSGVLPQRPEYHLPTFEKQKVLEVKQTPIKMGMMVFPGVDNRHPDYQPLQMLGSILGGGSGLMDQAVSEGRLMMAMLTPLSLEEAGSNVVMYVPNILGQSHEDAEKVVWDCLDSIKQGNFSDEVMQSIKVATYVENQCMVEDLEGLSKLMLQLELEGCSFEQWQRDNQRWMNLTRDEIMEVANRYFDRQHCTLVRSKMGFPKHDSAVKPDWDHLELQNAGAQSPFAKMIAANKPDPVKPQEIDFKKDVTITQLAPNTKLYSAPNMRNDVFELQLTYNYGLLDDYDLSNAVSYMEVVGANGMNLQQFNQAMGQLGGSVSVSVDDNNTIVFIRGLEQNLDSILALASSRFFHPTHDEKQVANLVDNMKAAQKASKTSSDEWFSALRAFVNYGEKSQYLRGATIKEWSTKTGQQLQDEVLKMFARNGYASFSGNTDPTTLGQKLHACGLVRDDVQTVAAHREFKTQNLKQSQIYYVHNKKFLQSDIYYKMPSIDFEEKDQAAAILFNEYFGGGMNSVVFQEIREFRSLGYSTYGYFYGDFRKNANPAYLGCFLGTQCDKTYDGVEAMRDLMVKMPVRPDKLAPAIEQRVAARNSSYVGFRQLPSVVCNWAEEYGWTYDRRKEMTDQIAKMTMDDLQAFYDKYLKNRPIVVMISGNAKKFNVKEAAKLLGENTPITELKFNQLFKF